MPVISRDGVSPITPKERLVNSRPLCAASVRVRELASASRQRAAQARRDNQEAVAWFQELRAEAAHRAESPGKAFVWMHACGVVGYFAGRNGAGIRVFINRAANSIRASQPGEKNLPRAARSNGASPTSPSESPFKESGSEEILEYQDPGAPSRARAGESSPEPGRDTLALPFAPPAAPDRELAVWKEELRVLMAELCDRELARTREWFERAGLPKATRVAQRETYDLLRAHGVIRDRRSDGGRVGENVTADDSPPLFTREESVRLYAAYAAEVFRVSFSEFLTKCVMRGEMPPGVAQAMLAEARELGLVSEPRAVSGRQPQSE